MTQYLSAEESVVNFWVSGRRNNSGYSAFKLVRVRDGCTPPLARSSTPHPFLATSSEERDIKGLSFLGEKAEVRKL